jgi:2-polyprenyl-3-methyl-5-hydroxy-6-metoxy-1,4-benzoquinol methylase
MDAKTHWETVYSTKAAGAVSWYRPHLDRSLSLIQRVAPDRGTSIIDVGGGESTLVDDLLQLGYRDLAVLDISRAAIDAAKARLGDSAKEVDWRIADITSAILPNHRYDLWHDRAVFHFMTTAEQRLAYTKLVVSSVKPGGHVIVATFGPQGPTKCSGLDVMRYDESSLHHEFGLAYRLVESSTELHDTPFGSVQQFLYCYCVKTA